MDKVTILEEIRRIALENGGVAPGRVMFERVTGIGEGRWSGKFWTRWSEAVSEAGLIPGQMQEALPEQSILTYLAELTRYYGRLPTIAEVKIARTKDKSIPSHNVFERLGDRAARIAKLRTFVGQREEYRALLDLLPDVETGVLLQNAAEIPVETPAIGDGYVYMLKLGRHYKIGKTFSVPRRHRQIALELPEKPDLVHSIQTDDPDGIESYWHKRFAGKRTNGEWFALDAQELKAFRRRKFM